LRLRAQLIGVAAVTALCVGGPARAVAPNLLFRLSADQGFTADKAGGDPGPNFVDKVRIVPTGAIGGAIQWDDDGVVTWNAPGNIYAQRGTLSFFWRSRTPVGEAPFNIFRVGFADHTSWDMAWLRVDWNGHGFDAFVTDANLARSDVDEIRIYDRMLAPQAVAALAQKQEPDAAAPIAEPALRQAWLHRFGWDRGSPPALTAPVTRIRKVEFADAKDLKEWMWKGVDGIDETTWPGVYNRSRLPGRDDYFELPDWNVYVEGGKAYDLTIPADERVNRVEISGAAYGDLGWSADAKSWTSLGRRPQAVVRSVDSFGEREGGRLRFT